MDPRNPQTHQTVFLLRWNEDVGDSELPIESVIYLFRSLEGVAGFLQEYWEVWEDLTVDLGPMPPVPSANSLQSELRTHIQLATARRRPVCPMTVLSRISQPFLLQLTLEEQELLG